MTEFNVKVRALAGFEKTAVVTPIGPLQESTCPVLSRKLHEVAEQGFRSIILDFSRVEILNGRAVVSLKGMAARLRTLGSQLSLVRVAPTQQRILAELSNPAHLPIYPDIKDVVGGKPLLGGRFNADTRLSEEFLEDSQEFAADNDWEFAQSDDEMFDDPDSDDGVRSPPPPAPPPRPDRSPPPSKRRATPRFDAEAQTPPLGNTPLPPSYGRAFPRPQSELEPPAPRPMDLESWSMPELIDPFASLEAPPSYQTRQPTGELDDLFDSRRAPPQPSPFEADDAADLAASQEYVPYDDKEPCEPPGRDASALGGGGFGDPLSAADPFSLDTFGGQGADPFGGAPPGAAPSMDPQSARGRPELDPFASRPDDDFGRIPGGFSPPVRSEDPPQRSAAFDASIPFSPPPAEPAAGSAFPSEPPAASRFSAPPASPFSRSPDLPPPGSQAGSAFRGFPEKPAPDAPSPAKAPKADDPFDLAVDSFKPFSSTAAGGPPASQDKSKKPRSTTPPSMDLFGAGDPFAGLEEPIAQGSEEQEPFDPPKRSYRLRSTARAPKPKTPPTRAPPPAKAPPATKAPPPAKAPAKAPPATKAPAPASRGAGFAQIPNAGRFAPPPRLTDPPTTFAPLPEMPQLKQDPPSPQPSPIAAAGASTAVAAARPAAAQPAPAAESAPEQTLSAEQTQKVHFSVFAPPCLRPGSSFLLKVWAFLESQREEVMRRARAARALSQAGGKGPVLVPKGALVTLILDLPGFQVPDPVETLLWDEEIADGSFEVGVPPNLAPGPRLGKISVLVAGLQVARVSFELQVAAGPVPDDLPSLPAPSSQHRVRSVFCSYASANRIEVLQWKRGAEVAGVDAFVDVLSLREGQNWEHELWRQVPSRDLFCLFWSEAAARSPWVEKEWRCALQSRGPDYIHPVSLVDPRVVPPPRELSGSKHFNDLTRIVMDYERHWRR